MATIITDICINCSLCGDPDVCPNGAITDGSDVGKDIYYIHPDLCTECVGEYDEPNCGRYCPCQPGCIIPDPNIVEDEATLVQRGLTLHPDDTVLHERITSGVFPSLKRKLPVVSA